MLHKTLIILASFTMLQPMAVAQEDSPATAFTKCARIANDARRLSCYDRLAADLIELGVTSMDAPTAAAAAAPPTASTPPVVAVAQSAQPQRPDPVATTSATTTQTGSPILADSEEAFGLERVESPKDEKKVKRIQSRYVGEFTGWDGDTVFTLENGQVWQQTRSGYMAKRAINPMITIDRGFMGAYRLSVEGVNKKVIVKRIK